MDIKKSEIDKYEAEKIDVVKSRPLYYLLYVTCFCIMAFYLGRTEGFSFFGSWDSILFMALEIVIGPFILLIVPIVIMTFYQIIEYKLYIPVVSDNTKKNYKNLLIIRGVLLIVIAIAFFLFGSFFKTKADVKQAKEEAEAKSEYTIEQALNDFDQSEIDQYITDHYSVYDYVDIKYGGVSSVQDMLKDMYNTDPEIMGEFFNDYYYEHEIELQGNNKN